MKKLLLFLLLAYTCTSYSQPIILRGGEIKDLKDCVAKYTTVFMVQAIGTNYALTSTDEGLIWSFAENQTSKKLKFQSITELFNYMDKWGWRYVDKLEDGLVGKMVYLFEKKENKIVPL
jgi:hypothetical protein